MKNENNKTETGIEYTKTVTLKEWKDAAGDIVIPTEIDGCRVTGIDEYALQDNENITSVVIPPGISFISHYAFSGCQNLREVRINDCDYIGAYAFADCDSLERVVISAVGSISHGVFGECHKLSEVIIGCATGINLTAFEECKAPTFITICDEDKETAVTRFADDNGYKCEKLNFVAERHKYHEYDRTVCEFNDDENIFTVYTADDDDWAAIMFKLCKILNKYGSKVYCLNDGYYAAACNGGQAEHNEIIWLEMEYPLSELE